MSILMCPNCLHLYKSNYIRPFFDGSYEEYFCPNAQCVNGGGEQLVEIDELMARPVQVLNKKGYATRYCCSGRSYDSYKISNSNAYIMFEGTYHFDTLPSQWYSDEYDDPECDGHKIITIKVSDRCKDKYIYMKALEKWVDQLPVNEEEE